MVGGRLRFVGEVEAGGRKLRIVGVHPSSPSPDEREDSRLRNRRLDGVAAGVEGAGRPVAVMGDFNTTPFSPHFRGPIAETGPRDAAGGWGWIGIWPTWLRPARVRSTTSRSAGRRAWPGSGAGRPSAPAASPLPPTHGFGRADGAPPGTRPNDGPCPSSTRVPRPPPDLLG